MALEYLMALGMDQVATHEGACPLRQPAAGRAELAERSGAGTGQGIFSFTMAGAAHAHGLSTILDKRGIAVRAGQHCAGPLMDHLGINASCRASIGLYNTRSEIDALVDALEFCHELFA
ncbi:MAG: aminotransferase class V-fold PLP-dependent enzyme [Paracoccaceae bacterium]